MKEIKPKVICAMSGGIDSSVAAALLKQAGYDVSGVFMKINDFSLESEKRARGVAKILKIPFLVSDLRKEFKKRIIDYFLEECERGVTPNPCVVCNKEIKFGLLLKKAISLDADFVATGHYARIRRGKDGIHLLRAEDKNKDQSYFLWMLNQKQLRRILFPVGNYTRKEVERLARKFKLPVLGAKKSVEICFIRTTIHPVKSPVKSFAFSKRKSKILFNRGISSKTKLFNGVNYFLKKYLRGKPGPVVEQVHYGVNKIVGEHQGLWFYTIGQRKGIGLPGGPYYVLDKDLKKNLLIVTKNERNLYTKELIAKNANWTSGKGPKLPLKVMAKIRYRHQSASATIYKIQNTRYKLLFNQPQRAITPGQSVVFYSPRSSQKAMVWGKGEELLGGGIIC